MGCRSGGERYGLFLGQQTDTFIYLQYGEKLVLLAEASSSIIAALPSIPPSAQQPYAGDQSTAATRAALQLALDNYRPGVLSHSFQPSAADLARSESRSFGETHAKELSSIESDANTGVTRPISPQAPTGDTPPQQSTPPVAAPLPVPVHAAPAPTAGSSPHSSPINPAELNNAPANIPAQSHSTATTGVTPEALRVSPDNVPDAQAPPPSVEPTVAETGVPVVAGAGGPGPSSGSLHDLRAEKSGGSPATASGAAIPAKSTTGATTPKQQSAEEEKARLQREERERLLQGVTASPESAGASGSQSQPGGEQKHATAEEEKKRLEREERERLLQSETGGNAGKDGNQGGDNSGPPPYQDL